MAALSFRVLAMTALTYLMYTAILRTRETHADATAACLAGDVDASDAALRRILDRSLPPDKVATGCWRKARWLWQGWAAVLRKRPSVVGVCGPIDVLVKAECRSAVASLAPVWYGLAIFLGAPRAVIATPRSPRVGGVVLPRVLPVLSMSRVGRPPRVRDHRLGTQKPAFRGAPFPNSDHDATPEASPADSPRQAPRSSGHQQQTPPNDHQKPRADTLSNPDISPA
jgi:hypothetical protein